MKRPFFLIAWLLAQTSGLAAEEAFSRTVAPSDYSAAGLQKLTPEELSRLDALVRDFKSGALEQARKEAAAATAAKARAEAAAARAEAELLTARADPQPRATASHDGKRPGGLLPKVLLPAGTEVEYSTIESRIAGDFRGWEPRTTFQLENGQRWITDGSGSYVTSPIASPAVKISAGALGAFYMAVKGVKPRVKVRRVGGDRP